MHKNDQETNVGLLVFVFLVVYMLMSVLASYFKNAVEPSLNVNDTVETQISYKADEIYDRLSEEPTDIGKYKAELVSSKPGDFTLRKIVGSTRYGDYRLITKMKDGNYKLITVSESSCNLYFLSDNKIEPYAILKFTPTSYDSPISVDVYIPMTYVIETTSTTDTIIDSLVD